ncbi:Holliday junction branch migration protein RuvA [Patescibacteria group bacterium]|nr:Holliday junction branch migration protein RuvA [Patescibacteria group bacterium]
MIGFLSGQVIFSGGNWVILRVNDVGYRVYCVGFSAIKDNQVEVFIHDHIREDRRELYGFLEFKMLELFERLIDISGVGTKLAQKILSVGTSDDISQKIIAGDLSFLTSISGVGTKTAQKIILEMKGVLVAEEDVQIDNDAIEALMSLGYSRQDCLEVLKLVDEEDTEARIRKALNLLGSN